MVEVTETKFKEDVEKAGYFIDKLQVNQFAFTDVMSDYLIQAVDFDIACEVKEVKLKNRKTEPTFKISRVTQESKLYNFEKRFPRNKSFIFFCWWTGRKETSSAYLVPIDKWILFRMRYKKSTIKFDEFNTEFCDFFVEVKNKIWNIKF